MILGAENEDRPKLFLGFLQPHLQDQRPGQVTPAVMGVDGRAAQLSANACGFRAAPFQFEGVDKERERLLGTQLRGAFKACGRLGRKANHQTRDAEIVPGRPVVRVELRHFAKQRYRVGPPLFGDAFVDGLEQRLQP